MSHQDIDLTKPWRLIDLSPSQGSSIEKDYDLDPNAHYIDLSGAIEEAPQYPYCGCGTWEEHRCDHVVLEFFEVDMGDAGRPNDPPEIKHTLWSAYNTITFFSDHIMSVSNEVEISKLYKQEEWDANTKKEMEKRLRRIWFGDAATLKVKAYSAAVGFQKAS